MTLLITVFAAITATVIWYQKAPNDTMKLGILCYIFWGASIMWLVDAIFEYAELHATFFNPAPADMLNDIYLGLSVVALGLVLWILIVLIKDPKGTVKAVLDKKKTKK